MRVRPKPSKSFAEYVRRIHCGEWVSEGLRGGDKGVLRHTSGATVAYNVHDGGNEWNSARNFAKEVQDACGCRLVVPRGRKRSRKKPGVQPDPQVEAQRQRYAARAEQRERNRG